MDKISKSTRDMMTKIIPISENKEVQKILIESAKQTYTIRIVATLFLIIWGVVFSILYNIYQNDDKKVEFLDKLNVIWLSDKPSIIINIFKLWIISIILLIFLPASLKIAKLIN